MRPAHALHPLVIALGLAACASDEPRKAPADGGGDDVAAENGGSGDTGTASDDAPSQPDTAPATRPGDDQSIRAMLGVDVYFTGAENRRQVDQVVELPPADQTFSAINLHLALDCPDGACDPWDRLGTFGLVLPGGGGATTYVELSRFITPYGVGHEWDVDVTDLRPLLTGSVTTRVFIDTWVGPGSPYGNGWSVTATFELTGGTPPRDVAGVVPVWPDNQRIVYGDPARPVSDQRPRTTVALPDGTRTAALRTFITGHGQGNADNCAEFCQKDHTFTVGATPFTRLVWRDDCVDTAAPGQRGTWQYPRAGWCPGAAAHDWTIDLRDLGDLSGRDTLDVAYGVADFENTCRPDAPTCAGCTLGNDCAWNDSNHTEPNFQVSALLIAYQ
jgi:hypothetical protein